MSDLTLLIVGGYGTFGGRIVELLEDEPRLTIVVAGRSANSAAAYCTRRTQAKARLVPAAFDRNGDFDAQIATHRPDILIDASGPFQAYGDDSYRLVRACIARGVHYLDLADGSEFVAGVSAFDQAARDADVYALSGVSSFPVLTAAVVRRLSTDMGHIDSIVAGIAPSPYAGVGLNVIRAIASYAGQPVRRTRDGKPGNGHPFTEQRRFTIAPPGFVPLRNTLFSLVDVPDLRVLPELWPEARTVWMGAGPVPEILHRFLIGFAWLVRWRLVPSLSPLAPLMHAATNRLAFGEHRGGMFVEVTGRRATGDEAKRSWHLLAEGNDGPLIPSMAVEAMVRRHLAGSPPASGARSAVRDLELADYEELFAGRTLHSGIRYGGSAGGSCLYAHLLGSAWEQLPAEIQAIHCDVIAAEGRAWVKRGRGLLSRLAGAIIGFPPASDDVPVRVRFDKDGMHEIWTRTFGDRGFSSRQFAGRGRAEHLLCERFGPLVFLMALAAEGDRLRLVLRGWRFLGLPLPKWLCPRSEAYESSADGRFRFNVEISHPLTGPIVHYSGWLVPVNPAFSQPSSAAAASGTSP